MATCHLSAEALELILRLSVTRIKFPSNSVQAKRVRQCLFANLLFIAYYVPGTVLNTLYTLSCVTLPKTTTHSVAASKGGGMVEERERFSVASSCSGMGLNGCKD